MNDKEPTDSTQAIPATPLASIADGMNRYRRTRQGLAEPVPLDGPGPILVKGRKETPRRHQRDKNRNPHSLAQLKVLYEITSALASSLDLDADLKRFMERVDQLLPYDAAALSLYDKERGRLEPVICNNFDMQDWKAGDDGGLAKAIIDRRVPLTSSDLTPDPSAGRRQFFRCQGFASSIGLPLLADDELKGMLALYTREAHEFAAEETGFLSELAGHAARAIQNCQLYRDVNHEVLENAKLTQAYGKEDSRLHELDQQLAALHSITTAASESLDLTTTLHEAVREITEIFNLDATRIYLVDPQRNDVCLKVSFENNPGLFAQRAVFQMGQGNIGSVAATGKPLIYENVQHDPAYDTRSLSKSARQAGFSFWAGFPIRSKSTIVGVICCIGRKSRRLRPEEMQLITSMANQIAIGVEYASRFEESWAQAREVLLFHHVTKVINRSLDLRTLLCGVMHEVRKLYKFDIGRIGLLERNGKNFAILADEGRLRKKVPRARNIMKRVLKVGRPVFFDDMKTDPLYKKWTVHQSALKAGFRSAFYIPIKSKQKTLGVIGFLGKRVHRFSRNEVRLVFSITHHLGTAVENAQLYEAVQRSREQLRGLAQRIQVAREEERSRLARRVHDDLGQRLTALKMEIGMCPLARRSNVKTPCFALIDPMLNTVRNITAGLRPAVLDDLGLTEAIEWEAEDFQKRTGIQCKVRSSVKEDSLDPGRAVAVFRIFQEVLSNVARHAGADKVKVEWKTDSGDLLLRVSDNGSGIKRRALTDHSSFGILGMKERALVCGGHLEMSGIRGKGTIVSLRIRAH